MNCETALDLVSASLDGELTAEEEARLQAHLDQCPRCRALRTELLGIHAACGEMEAPPPAQLKDHILAHLPPQETAKAAKGPVWRRWAALAAALVLVALAAWRLPRSLFERPAAQTADSAAQVVEEAVEETVDEAAAPAEAAGSAQGAVNGAGEGGSISPAGDGGRAKMAALTDDESAVWEDAAGEVNVLERKEVYGAAAPSLSDESAAEDEAAEGLDRGVGAAFADAAGGGASVQDGAEGSAAAPASLDGAVAVEDEAAEGAARGAFAARRAPAPDTVYAVDGADAVPETVPNPEEPPATAQPFEEVAEDERDFSRYRAVLTLDQGGFSGDYPRQRQENGDMWYLLPLSDLEALLERAGDACHLRQEGPDLTADAPYVLLVVPGDG